MRFLKVSSRKYLAGRNRKGPLMRVTEALEIFEQSPSSFKAEIEKLSIKELYQLVKDLRLFSKPEIFKTSYDVLVNKKLLPLLKEVEALEKTITERGLLILHKHIYEETGFRVDSETLPNVAVRQMINEITNRSQ